MIEAASTITPEGAEQQKRKAERITPKDLAAIQGIDSSVQEQLTILNQEEDEYENSQKIDAARLAGANLVLSNLEDQLTALRTGVIDGAERAAVYSEITGVEVDIVAIGRSFDQQADLVREKIDTIRQGINELIASASEVESYDQALELVNRIASRDKEVAKVLRFLLAQRGQSTVVSSDLSTPSLNVVEGNTEAPLVSSVLPNVPVEVSPTPVTEPEQPQPAKPEYVYDRAAHPAEKVSYKDLDRISAMEMMRERALNRALNEAKLNTGYLDRQLKPVADITKLTPAQRAQRIEQLYPILLFAEAKKLIVGGRQLDLSVLNLTDEERNAFFDQYIKLEKVLELTYTETKSGPVKIEEILLRWLKEEKNIHRLNELPEWQLPDEANASENGGSTSSDLDKKDPQDSQGSTSESGSVNGEPDPLEGDGGHGEHGHNEKNKPDNSQIIAAAKAIHEKLKLGTEATDKGIMAMIKGQATDLKEYVGILEHALTNRTDGGQLNRALLHVYAALKIPEYSQAAPIPEDQKQKAQKYYDEYLKK